MVQDKELTQPEEFSLVWPAGTQTSEACPRTQLDPGVVRDLGIPILVRSFNPSLEYQKEIQQILTTLCPDLEVIRYRQEILEDLINQPRLAARLEGLLPIMDALGRYTYPFEKGANTLHEVSWRVGELQGIFDCIQGLDEAFQEIGEELASEGLGRLRNLIAGMRDSAEFQLLEKELPDMLARLRSCASLTIGVNLDPLLRPVEATLVSVNEEKFTTPGLLTRLFGKNNMSGIAPLHGVPGREVEGPYAFPIDPELGRMMEPMMVPLFRDLAKIIEKITLPIARELKRYTELRGLMFRELRRDLIFYLGGLRLVERMRGHRLPVCRPKLAPVEERLCLVEEAYNINLALITSAGNSERDLSETVVCNDLYAGPEGRILILTGPNQGGKTTYIQGAGLIQVLAQAGLYVPGAQAHISPVDSIFTHFPLEEKMEADTGRFGDEAKRLGAIFQQVTPASLVLLNETLSSTSAGESLYLAQDIVRILRRVGLRAIYSTHLHELAAQAEEINQTEPGESKVTSLVSSPVEEEPGQGGDIRRSYRIEARPPMGRSYAREIAARFGIGYSQLEDALAERGVLQKGD
jgi:DNA mismatch repair protein MutS